MHRRARVNWHNRGVVINPPGPSLSGLGVDIPHRAEPTAVRSLHGRHVVEVVLILRQQEHSLVSLRGPVTHRLGMRVGLVPDHFGSQPPPGVLESEGKPPRNADQILRLQANWGRRSHRHRPCPVLSIRRAVLPISRCVAVSDVEPDGAVIGENAPNLVEGHNDALDVLSERVIATDLVGNVVVSQRPVRRRGHVRLHAPSRQKTQGVGCATHTIKG